MASSIVNPRDEPIPDKSIDREKICPFLLRVFINQGRHHQANEFARGNVPPNEMTIYTWSDATLKELSGLIKEVNPEARRVGTVFDFAVVFPNNVQPNYRMLEIGSTVNGKKGQEDKNLTLSQINFQVGDYLDVAIHLPSSGNAPPHRGDRGGNQRRMKPNRY